MTKIACYSQKTLPRKYKGEGDGFFAYNRNCQELISDGYIRESVEKADYVVLAFKKAGKAAAVPRGSRRRAGGALAGFAFLRERGGGLHIDLICSNRRLGNAIIHRIERKADEIGAEFVDLNSVKGALPFYKRNGYMYARNPTASDAANPCTMKRPSLKRRAMKLDEDGSHLWRMAKCTSADAQT